MTKKRGPKKTHFLKGCEFGFRFLKSYINYRVSGYTPEILFLFSDIDFKFYYFVINKRKAATKAYHLAMRLLKEYNQFEIQNHMLFLSHGQRPSSIPYLNPSIPSFPFHTNTQILTSKHKINNIFILSSAYFHSSIVPSSSSTFL